MVDLAHAKSCDFILCVGDIFDKPNPGQQVKDMLIEQLLCHPDMKFIFTLGNHDYCDKAHSYHSLKTFELLQPKLNNLSVLPFGVTKYHWGEIVSLPDPPGLTEVPDKGPGFRVVCFHGVVQGANPHLQTEQSAAKMIERYKGNYLALGDIHLHKLLIPNGGYSGPPLQKTFGCQEGLILVELSGDVCKTESLHLALPKKINIEVSKFEIGRDSEQSIIDGILEEFPERDHIKLKFHLPQTVWAKIDHQRIQKELGEFYPEVRLENDPGMENRTRENTSSIVASQSIEEEISKVIELESLNLDKKRLLQVCLEFTKC
jgi:DNA repair exonuclease SbcCD nuclease subunit